MDWIVELRHPLWTQVFLAFSALGSSTFFLVAFTLGYWLLDRATFLRVSVVLMVVALFNSVLKATFQIPRPDSSLHLTHADGWSLPSGHAMIAGAVWPWLARETQRLWAWIGAALLVAGVATSRVYLGVHFPRDVIVGAILGLACLVVLWPLAEMAPAVWARLGGHQRFGIAVIPVLLLLYVLPENGDETAAQAGGALAGLVLGVHWERKTVRFQRPRGTRNILAAALVGLLGIFALRWGLGEIFATFAWEERWSEALQNALIALYFAFVAPWIFVRAGWCDTEDVSAPASCT